jgi:hypothetical protein
LAETRSGSGFELDVKSLASVLKTHLQEQKQYWLKHPRKKPDCTLDTSCPVWLFPNEIGNWPVMINIANRHFYRCLDKAGLHRPKRHVPWQPVATK